MRQTRTAPNRSLLGAAGLALLLAGGWLTATAPAVAERLPSWWPAATGGVLLDRDRLVRLRGDDWWVPTAMAAAIVLTALFTCWFLAQFRVGPTRNLPLPAPGGTVRCQALAEALALRAAAVPGVARTRARVLPRRRRRLEVRLRVRLQPDASPDTVLPALCAVTAEAEQAVAPCTTHTRIRLSTPSHRVPRVR